MSKNTSIKFPIAYKLAAVFITIVVLTVGCLGVLIVSYQLDLMRQQIDHFGQGVVDLYSGSAKEPLFTDSKFSLDILTANFASNTGIEGVAVYKTNGESFVKEGLVPVETIGYLVQNSTALSDHHKVWSWQQDMNGRTVPLLSYLKPIVHDDLVKGQVTGGFGLITVSTDKIRRSFFFMIAVLVISIIATVLCAALAALWISRRMMNPINQLVEATERLSENNFDIVLPEKRNDELGYLASAFNKMIKSLHDKRQMEGVFSKILSNDVAAKFLEDIHDVRIGSERVEASVLFVDSVGFTAFTEQSQPEDVVQFVNECFTCFNDCANACSGVVDKYIGDCMMSVFGAPNHAENHRYQAIACGIMIVRLLKEINQAREAAGKVPINVRVGINSGQMMAGIFGTEQRLEYTVIGDVVNLAARLESIAPTNSVVIGEDVYQPVSLQRQVFVEPYKMTMVKGRSKPVMTYVVSRLNDKLEKSIQLKIKTWRSKNAI